MASSFCAPPDEGEKRKRGRRSLKRRMIDHEVCKRPIHPGRAKRRVRRLFCESGDRDIVVGGARSSEAAV